MVVLTICPSTLEEELEETTAMEATAKRQRVLGMGLIGVGLLMFVAIAVAATVVSTTQNRPASSAADLDALQHEPPRGLRPNNNTAAVGTETMILCRVSLFEFLYEDGEQLGGRPERNLMCSPIDPETGEDDGMNYFFSSNGKNDEILQLIQDGEDVVLRFTKASIDAPSSTIVQSDESVVTRVENRKYRGRRRLLPSAGRIRALGIIVKVGGVDPVYSSDRFYQLLFQDNVSLKNQYMKCSMGKLIIEPTGLGVIKVEVNVALSTSKPQQIINDATRKALEYIESAGYGTFSNLREFTEMSLFLLPPMGSWLAYASVGLGTSVYNGKWGGFIASLMHETGHNFQLFHAFEGEEYHDYTGYMGGAVISYHDQTNFPAMCFNAANHWELGWYSDRALEVDMYQPTLVRLAAFVDYELTDQGVHYVVVKSGNVVMHYNRAKGINANTYEYANCLTIYQSMSEGSYLFAANCPPDQTYYEKDFGSTGTWHAEICQVVDGKGLGPDYMLISIGFGASVCPQLPQSTAASATSASGGPSTGTFISSTIVTTKIGPGTSSGQQQNLASNDNPATMHQEAADANDHTG